MGAMGSDGEIRGGVGKVGGYDLEGEGLHDDYDLELDFDPLLDAARHRAHDAIDEGDLLSRRLGGVREDPASMRHHASCGSNGEVLS